jgi:hypothetical protein
VGTRKEEETMEVITGTIAEGTKGIRETKEIGIRKGTITREITMGITMVSCREEGITQISTTIRKEEVINRISGGIIIMRGREMLGRRVVGISRIKEEMEIR